MQNPGIGRAYLNLSGSGSAQFKLVLCQSQMHMQERGLVLVPKVTEPWLPPGWGSGCLEPCPTELQCEPHVQFNLSSSLGRKLKQVELDNLFI